LAEVAEMAEVAADLGWGSRAATAAVDAGAACRAGAVVGTADGCGHLLVPVEVVAQEAVARAAAAAALAVASWVVGREGEEGGLVEALVGGRGQRRGRAG
jgi:hypothetical protein